MEPSSRGVYGPLLRRGSLRVTDLARACFKELNKKGGGRSKGATRLTEAHGPFDGWFRERISDIFGLDLTQPPPPLVQTLDACF